MTVEAYAKVNLTLEVFGTRPDGYHALRSVVLPITLADTISIEPTDDGVISSDLNVKGDLNLKAAEALRAATGAKRGARIRVEKRIPMGGGLGGGSADAAAVLRALDELWVTRLGAERLAEIGATVGSDVPALVLGQTYRCPVVMEGRGETVRVVKPLKRPLHLVLANPGVHSSTPEVYARCVARDPGDGAILREMLAALESGDLPRISAALLNDLEAPAIDLHPEIGETLAAMRAAGAVGVRMSGSGASVFGVVETPEESLRIAAEMCARGISAWACEA